MKHLIVVALLSAISISAMAKGGNVTEGIPHEYNM